MGVRSTLQLPKEHGSWGMFFIPLVLGLLVGRQFTAETALLAVSACAAFLAREPFMTWWRAWRRGQDAVPARRAAGIWLIVSVVFGAALLPEYPWLAVLGVIGIFVFCWSAELGMKGEGRKAAPELMAIGTSMLLAPAAWYVATERLDGTALLLWALCFGYFASSVFYVKMRVAAARPRDPSAPGRTRRWCLEYHLALLTLIALLTASRVPVLAALGFVPVLARAFWYIFRPTSGLNLKQVGWTEVAYSLWFLAAVSTALR